MRRLAILAVLLMSAVVRADDEEAYLGFEVGPALARSGQSYGEGGTSGNAAGASGTLVLAYGLTDTWTLDLAVGSQAVFNSRHDDVMLNGIPRNIFTDVVTARTTAGISARLGARVIPTLGLRAGYQHRILRNAVQFDDTHFFQGDLDPVHENELIALASLGLEIRLNRHWHLGIAAQAVAALGGSTRYLAFEAPVRLSYAWYPRLFRSMRTVRFGE